MDYNLHFTPHGSLYKLSGTGIYVLGGILEYRYQDTTFKECIVITEGCVDPVSGNAWWLEKMVVERDSTRRRVELRVLVNGKFDGFQQSSTMQFTGSFHGFRVDPHASNDEIILECRGNCTLISK